MWHRQVVEHPGAVAVVALDEAGRVLLIRQYRHPVGPAALGDPGRAARRRRASRRTLPRPGNCSRRPATGRADWQVLADYFSSPGIITERIRVFLARGLRRVPEEERNYCRVARGGQLDAALGAAWTRRWTG